MMKFVFKTYWLKCHGRCLIARSLQYYNEEKKRAFSKKQLIISWRLQKSQVLIVIKFMSEGIMQVDIRIGKIEMLPIVEVVSSSHGGCPG